MLNVNGPGFAGLFAGDIVEWQPHRWEYTHRRTVLPLLVFADHVQVRFGSFGATVDAANFVRLIRRGKRHIAADRELADFYAVHPAD
jgi:hypothetical protein